MKEDNKSRGTITNQRLNHSEQIVVLYSSICHLWVCEPVSSSQRNSSEGSCILDHLSLTVSSVFLKIPQNMASAVISWRLSGTGRDPCPSVPALPWQLLPCAACPSGCWPWGPMSALISELYHIPHQQRLAASCVFSKHWVILSTQLTYLETLTSAGGALIPPGSQGSAGPVSENSWNPWLYISNRSKSAFLLGWVWLYY